MDNLLQYKIMQLLNIWKPISFIQDSIQNSGAMKKSIKKYLANYNLDESFTHAPKEVMYATLQYIKET